ncbi:MULTISPECIES: hypothetical protein [unclassified Acetobacter]|uniref:hypothetical protein n=1 Tax=unclassified Acetobacter TaxID=2628570 RepID=UPI001237F013|nr:MULTISPECIES: hypothetical protein [unclassified Acetobacter]KAA8395831.1 hypothetical protein FKW19_09635 [Acetobacter sp. DmW_125128]KAA8397329.1 hypothetical protein FKW22_04760 [Acetobacter sp. DmW_125124]KAA8397532.1 hypothetical protein FKW20_09160 [Acetobacter sp. DmW_125127]KAA8401426.1 hypothetical protein FKW24_14995 [Acetobacter sp. DmW_125134]KAA8404425.1 hypothetical protein FKW32_08640 [Acetobacter sp. DmW_125132]
MCINNALQRLPRIEPRSKKVLKSNNYRKLSDFPDIPEISQEKRQNLVAALRLINEHISNGYGLPEEMYRTNIDTTTDNLLDYAGIMHIHPLGKGSSEVLYLVQTQKCVGLLELTDHRHFDRIQSPHSAELINIHGEFIRRNISQYNNRIFEYSWNKQSIINDNTS